MLEEKLLEIQKLLVKVKKWWVNPHFKSKYITLDWLLDILIPLCNERDILIRHATENQEVVTTVAYIKSKESSKSEYLHSRFPVWDISNPQKIGSAITYAKRYNLWQLFNIVTDEDDDWEKASEKTKTKETPAKIDKVADFNDGMLIRLYARSEWKEPQKIKEKIDSIRDMYDMTDSVKESLDLLYATF